MPARTSARDDDSGRQYTVISKGEKMTKTAAPALVISTAAERSGEISRPYGTVGMAAGDLGALSFYSPRGFMSHTGMFPRSR